MRTIAIVALVAALATPALATEDFCAVVLKTPDGFLAMRSGPGMRFPIKMKLKQGDVLYADTRKCVIGRPNICDDSGTWVYVYAVQNVDAKADKVEGWIAGAFVQTFLCPEGE